jgi:hypothetical protein
MPSPTGQQQRGWWASNWKWCLPVGCAALVLLFAGAIAGLFALVAGSLRSSWAHAEGLRLARHHPDVVAALGEPIDTGWLVSGSIRVTGPSGEADLAIPVQGPKGKATLYVIAHRRAGQWSLELAEVALPGQGGRINLTGAGGRVSNTRATLSVAPGHPTWGCFTPDGAAAARPRAPSCQPS